MEYKADPTLLAYTCHFTPMNRSREGNVVAGHETLIHQIGVDDIAVITIFADGQMHFNRELDVRVVGYDPYTRRHVETGMSFKAKSATIDRGKLGLVIRMPDGKILGISWNIMNPQWYK